MDRARPKQSHHAIDVVRQLDLYCCFNMLAFDPDTTLESLFSAWPQHTYVKVTAMCATPTVVNSTLTFDIDTSAPKNSGDVPIALRLPDEADAGAP